MDFKKSLARAFITSSYFFVIGFIVVVVYFIFHGSLSVNQIFSIPLISFYVSLGGFVMFFPISLLYFLYEEFKRKKTH